MFLKDLERVCKINSYTQNKEGVDEVSRVMQEWMEKIGFETVVFKRQKIGNHTLFKSKRAEGEKILFLGHNDTVFPKGTFEEFCYDETWVYGPGVCDMKGGNIVALESLRNLYKSFGEIKNVDFFLVSDEETGSDDSKDLTLELAKDYDYCFVFEAAGENLEVVTARKGVGTFSIEIEGRASHSGVRYEDGIDANYEAACKLIELKKLTDLKAGTTLNVGIISGGVGANTISPKAKIEFELRYTNKNERDRVLGSIDKIVKNSYEQGSRATLSGLIQRDVMEQSEAQLEFLKKLESIVGQKIPYESRGGVSDANHVASCGVITLDGFGPYGDGDHTTKERALIGSFYQRIEMVSRILEHFVKNGYSFKGGL